MMSWLIMKQEMHFSWYFKKEKHLGIKTWNRNRLLHKGIFHGKIVQKIWKINSAQAFLNFWTTFCKMWTQI